ncbi:50S ribosomal protein L16 [Microgenomates group bacterium RBG_19FT_COMBO_39_10]|nr:ribosomal protein L16 [uncultured bacterium]OGV89208.1 MAG: 50S ribosomal protein L16 [Microgenomates group bacterium RBG_19FT_COMBO_39_10]
MLEPKRAKYRKQFRGRMKGKSIRGSTLTFGDYGLKSLGRGWLMARQIEAARKAITHQTKRQGKIWIRVFPDKPVTKKPAGVRMGSGKGAIDHHVAVVTPGRIIFELAGVDEKIAKEAIKRAGAKLPFRTKFIKKD